MWMRGERACARIERLIRDVVRTRKAAAERDVSRLIDDKERGLGLVEEVGGGVGKGVEDAENEAKKMRAGRQ